MSENENHTPDNRPSLDTAKTALKRLQRAPLTEEEMDQLLHEFGHQPSARGTALIGAAILDAILGNIIRTKFRTLNRDEDDRIFSGDNAPLGTFSAKIKISYALSICSREERKELDLIRDIRNAFAHALKPLTFETKEVANLCAHLRVIDNPDIADENRPRIRLVGSVSTLTQRFGRRVNLLALALRQNEGPTDA